MMKFPEPMISAMITGSLIFISIAVIVLISLLIHDIKHKKLW